MYERIVVPLDGSELAEKALPTAEDLAELTGAPLHLVRVVDLTRLDRYGAYGGLAVEYAGFELVAGEERQVATEYLERMTAELTGRGRSVTTAIVDGSAPHALVGLTKPSDVVVMASHGRTGLARWFLGSVAEEVVRHATVPVMLVRALPATQEPAPTNQA